jgi:hypothetical protein
MSFKPQDQKAHMRKRHSLKGTLHYLLPEHVLQVVLLIQGSTKSKQNKLLLLRAILLKFSKSIPIAPPPPPTIDWNNTSVAFGRYSAIFQFDTISVDPFRVASWEESAVSAASNGRISFA